MTLAKLAVEPVVVTVEEVRVLLGEKLSVIVVQKADANFFEEPSAAEKKEMLQKYAQEIYSDVIVQTFITNRRR